MSKVIFAPEKEKINSKIIFLAGPIQGAPDWHTKAIRIISKLDPDIIIACPKRYNITKTSDFGDKDYAEQVDWETHALRLTEKYGVIMFWLAVQTIERKDRSYAQTTRFELAEWKMRHEFRKARLALGIEKGFFGERYLRRRFGQDCPEIKIQKSLKETCEEAGRLLKSKKNY